MTFTSYNFARRWGWIAFMTLRLLMVFAFDGHSTLAAKALPELETSISKYAELVENILNAQKAGHPEILTHGGDIAGNRPSALGGVPNLKPFSRDEYPFASSIKGGGGSWVGHPVSQQNAQGALMENFFKQYNIQPGDQYRVVIKP